MRRFEKGDIETLNAWRLERGLGPLNGDELPDVGYIEEGVAVGFLMRTEVKALAILDSFHTNPAAPVVDRHDAISRLVWHLCSEAYIRGVSKVGGWTRSRGMARICEKLGFERTEPHVALGKDLR